MCYRLGVSAALWLGVLLCVLGFLATVYVIIMDSYGTKQLGQDDAIAKSKARRSIRDVTKFGAVYWFLLLTLVFFYASIMPFVANSV